ncbi:LysM peptidoglycan-binding domain-containing protein [Parashewanella curva]|uniref:LysM peptidoglycan-binding domain-containing protein n=1 Tax=Parashewanella curva TaxID=2338552 RepID=A0A3L8PUR3_9GAMM|nr:L,D-transpeptidase family protein [Parashewanella curva]RLV59056.1 LysM peptidoglycan-binding domain-containing protein [Parashewanella curva]
MKQVLVFCWLLLFSQYSYGLSYDLPANGDSLVGRNEIYVVPQGKLSLEHIAAQFSVGLTNLMQANPNVDPFLPRAGRKLIIPQKLILPKTVRRGIVINLAEMRLYYYPKRKKTVEVYPIGIGEVGKETPENWITRVWRKKANPTWTPTTKMKAEYLAQGVTLPDVWPAGSDNPMGAYALYIGNMFAIHGTNANFGIGLRISHGCIRLRNKDIEHLFKTIPIGTRVQIINEPIKVAALVNGERYIEVHQPLSKNQRQFDSNSALPLTISKPIMRFIANAATDSEVLKQALEERSGLAVVVGKGKKKAI